MLLLVFLVLVLLFFARPSVVGLVVVATILFLSKCSCWYSLIGLMRSVLQLLDDDFALPNEKTDCTAGLGLMVQVIATNQRSSLSSSSYDNRLLLLQLLLK